ncbi:hypothetical protein GWI33_020969 [Rhynchophorus ferrugineus]|uniref:Uncharacterized protein n=1 Tax=Rhynchophorus ferrugineus TaxID=354439 RepID=A0A834HPV1_RHYFE|nr:hypothetical protein GWI33_020969 [Rhynchophorus ferrugineus]
MEQLLQLKNLERLMNYLAAVGLLRGSNISILHLRSTSEPWEKETVPNYSSAARSYFASSRSTTAASAPSAAPPLTKHQSLGSSTSSSATHKWTTSPSFHSGSEVNSPGIFTFSGSCNRELSPVRWCDREVDGVYLGKSGWVQVQQRSLDDNRRASYSINLAKSLQSNRTGIKLANYHFSSEPNKSSSFSRTSSVDPRLESRPEPRSDPQPDTHRPAYLVLQNREYDRKIKTPSPLPESGSFSPPSITPIISPPPAFQDKTKSPVKSRAFFGKTPFLPRSNAIEDSDNSPPRSPPIVSQWKTTAPNAPTLPKPKPVIKTSPGIEKPPRATKKVPQAKSLEETTASRRMQFKQKYGSSSSSSSSMGFRSLDSCLNRTSSVMPRLSENTDSSIDVYEDADEEDNNSSSVNMSMVNTAALQAEYNRKLSPSGRPNRLTHYRNQIRRSPAGSDTNKHSPTSSSSSSNEFLSRSPTNNPQQPIRRPAPVRPYQPVKSPQDDATQRVRRSRSLQLPERTPPPSFERAQKVSPQHPDQHRVVVKVTGNHQMPERKQYSVGSKQTSMERGEVLEEELLREAEVVTGFLYGSRSRAAAQALLMHRYNNNNISAEEKNKESNKPMLNSDLTVYYVGNNKNERQRLLVRGATSPSLPTTHQFDSSKSVSCSPENCDFWPHCAHRDSLNREAQFVMRSSQSYPSHQRSLDSAVVVDTTRPPLSGPDRKPPDQYKRRLDIDGSRSRKTTDSRRTSPGRPPATGGSVRRNGSTEIPVN